MRRLALVVLAAVPPAVVALHESAHADDTASATVVVLAPPDSALGKRVAAELAAMGLTVRMRPAPASGALADIAAALRADGAVRVAKDSLDVWLLEPTAHREVTERVPLGTTEAEQVTAIHRATEVMRTELWEPLVAHAATPTPTPTPTAAVTVTVTRTATPTPRAPGPQPTAHSPQPPPPPRFSLWLAQSFSWSGPATQTSLDLAAGATARLAGPLLLELRLTRSLTPTTVTATAGTADVEAWTLGLAARVRFGNTRFGGGGGLGVAGVWLLLTGHATAPYQSDRADVLTLMPFAVAGLDVGIVRNFALRADVMLGFSAPRASIVFAEQPVADWGVPLLAATLGAEVRFP